MSVGLGEPRQGKGRLGSESRGGECGIFHHCFFLSLILGSDDDTNLISRIRMNGRRNCY
jgi:hypothetical protein